MSDKQSVQKNKEKKMKMLITEEAEDKKTKIQRLETFREEKQREMNVEEDCTR